MTDNPYDSPQRLGESPEKSPRRWMPRLIELLAVLGVLAMLVALVLPARRGSREAARRTQCSNNLKQIALALQLYVDTHGALPPAYTVDASGNRLHSWRTLILPYLQLQDLYDRIDLTKPWDHPANREVFQTELHTYRCPSAPGAASQTVYFAAVGSNRCIHPTESRKLTEITDRHDLTVMLVEGDPDQAVHWMSPYDIGEEEILSSPAAEQSPHLLGRHFATVSGGTFFLPANVEMRRLTALLSIDGGDDSIVAEDD